MSNAVATIPQGASERGIDSAQWNTLCNSLFPGAKHDSILMVIDYCKARKLDPLKKPCHIVPIRCKIGGNYEWRDVVMAGIYEYRTTAQRTGDYLGHSKPDYGQEILYAGVKAPEWCEITVYRWNERANLKVEFPARVYFKEVCALKDGKANDRWGKAPIQMITKCAEAAALREAFPDELGGTTTDDEMIGKTIGDAALSGDPEKSAEQQAFEDEHLPLLRDAAMDGLASLTAAFTAIPKSPMKVAFWTEFGESLKSGAANATVILGEVA